VLEIARGLKAAEPVVTITWEGKNGGVFRNTKGRHCLSRKKGVLVGEPSNVIGKKEGGGKGVTSKKVTVFMAVYARKLQKREDALLSKSATAGKGEKEEGKRSLYIKGLTTTHLVSKGGRSLKSAKGGSLLNYKMGGKKKVFFYSAGQDHRPIPILEKCLPNSVPLRGRPWNSPPRGGGKRRRGADISGRDKR